MEDIMVKFLCKIAHKILNKYEPFEIHTMGFTTKDGRRYEITEWENNFDGSILKVVFQEV